MQLGCLGRGPYNSIWLKGRLTPRCSGAAPAPLRWEVGGGNAPGGSGQLLGWGRPLNLLPLGEKPDTQRAALAEEAPGERLGFRIGLATEVGRGE